MLSFEPDFGLKFQPFLSLFDQKFLLGLKVGPKRLSFEPDFGLKFQPFLSLFDQKFLLGQSPELRNNNVV
jgi:hypothetical protein